MLPLVIIFCGTTIHHSILHTRSRYGIEYDIEYTVALPPTASFSNLVSHASVLNYHHAHFELILAFVPSRYPFAW